jgi:hypothetical protein
MDAVRLDRGGNDMNKTIFDVDDIYELRVAREAEYASMSRSEASRLRAERADNEWGEIAKIRRIINDFYKCPNVLSPQPDKLPAPKFMDSQSIYG